jgi:Rhs element Vgr protein
MAESPLVSNMDLTSLEILANGSPIKNTLNVISIEVERQVGRTARANFSIELPSIIDANPFAISEGKEFLPGVPIEIKAGYHLHNKTIFKGKIIGHRIKARPGGLLKLWVRCQATAAKLTVTPKTATFEKMTDSDVISSVLSNSSIQESVATTSFEHPQLIQHRITDWDFILSRAAANGMIVYSESDKVFVSKPTVSGAAELKLTYGVDVLEFDGELDAGNQLPDASAESWDFASGEMIKGNAKEPSVNAQGNIKTRDFAGAIDLPEEQFRTTLPLPETSLKSLANAVLLQSRLAAIRGRVVFPGNASPKLNSLIELNGFGARFNGMALITAVHHIIGDGNWTTEISFGLSPNWRASTSGFNSNSLEETSQISGLQNGIVTNIHEDPEGQARIKVSIPVLGTEVWARQATLYATRGAGAFFLPEIGDEVLLGFLADDPRFAVVLGSLPGPNHKSGYQAEENNKIKALTTKAGLKLELNDEDKTFTIATPGKNTVVLSDKDKSIVLTDENDNTITLDKTGITLKSTGDIVLDASGKLSIKAKQAIEINATGGELSLEGVNVNAVGKQEVKMEGGASAVLSSSGNTTIKGAMVMIN